MLTPAEFLDAARVPETLQPQTFGLWTIERRGFEETILGEPIFNEWGNDYGAVGWPTFTLLRRVTLRSLHRDLGEVVMEDTRRELSRHLPIWLAARGRVLVTGLGLGCVVRGLLANPEVTSIDVVEKDAGIVRVVWPEFGSDPRCRLIQGDARTVEIAGSWDFAWHDLHDDDDDPCLQTMHAMVIKRFGSRATKQGAWMLPRLLTAFCSRDWILGGPKRRRGGALPRPRAKLAESNPNL